MRPAIILKKHRIRLYPQESLSPVADFVQLFELLFPHLHFPKALWRVGGDSFKLAVEIADIVESATNAYLCNRKVRGGKQFLGHTNPAADDVLKR